jgi:signal transduction histidine kinase/DNA-binding response OmpR family regulator
MKKFYIIFFTGCVLFSVLLYFSIWWLIAGVALVILFTAYRYYSQRLKVFEASISNLEQQTEELEIQLDRSIAKEQKATKEAGMIRQLKQELLTIISHEIRTPMNGVLGMALLLEDTPLTKEQKEYLDIIRKSGHSLLTPVNDILVNDILDYSKLQQKGMQLEYKDFGLRDCVEEVLEMFAAKAGKANVDLLYFIDENVPEQILSDNKRLRQILMNLLENAVRFTQQGEIFVAVYYSENTAGSLSMLNFEVRDTGAGIAADKLPDLFYGIRGKEFQKENEKDSSGLGLVVCRKLIELMSGHIEVKSEPGQGSIFTFGIPVTPGKKPAHDATQPDTMNSLEGKRILIVDDNANSRNILIKQMQAWKMLPTGSDSGNRAQDILSQNGNFDLVLTDMNMPFMDGMELARFVKNQYPDIPLMLMNHRSEGLYKQEHEIFSFVLAKPIRQHILRDNLLSLFTNPGAGKESTANNLTETFAEQYPMRILIAEDNLINQKIATKILTKLGYQPAIANNGKEALETVSREKYDIILMDVQMPEMNGLEATKMIRTCLEIQPIIMAMTANVLQGDRDDCMQAGMDDYISKPIDLKELLSHLEKWGLVIKEKRNTAAA